MHRRKIVKKITKHPHRFQSDRFKRLNVGTLQFSLNLAFFYSQNLTELLEVLIARPEEDSEESLRSQRLVTSKIIKLDTSWLMDSRRCSSVMRRISNCSSWTTEFSAVKSPTTFQSERGKSIIIRFITSELILRRVFLATKPDTQLHIFDVL